MTSFIYGLTLNPYVFFTIQRKTTIIGDKDREWQQKQTKLEAN